MNERIPQGLSETIAGDKKVPNPNPPWWAALILVAFIVAIIAPFVIMLWRWALS